MRERSLGIAASGQVLPQPQAQQIRSGVGTASGGAAASSLAIADSAPSRAAAIAASSSW
ncbi:MAG: hypothetical protein IPN32_15395 [Deltaproteobacteria bacterium]|nr:hypothetical protein [Deltaproteobacteria bacterium]